MASVPHRLLLVLLLAWIFLPVQAGRIASGLGAQATVQPVLHLTLFAQPTTLTIRVDDIARGYVDVAAATVLQVRSNSREGYLLTFQNIEPFITAVIVQDGERFTHLSPADGMLHYTAADVTDGRTSVLSYRLFLSERAEAGSYAWPLQLEVVPD